MNHSIMTTTSSVLLVCLWPQHSSSWVLWSLAVVKYAGCLGVMWAQGSRTKCPESSEGTNVLLSGLKTPEEFIRGTWRNNTDTTYYRPCVCVCLSLSLFYFYRDSAHYVCVKTLLDKTLRLSFQRWERDMCFMCLSHRLQVTHSTLWNYPSLTLLKTYL